MYKANFRNGQEGSVALALVPILLAVGALVCSGVLMYAVHNLQYRADQLQSQLNATTGANALLNSSLPKGSVSFEQLSPDLQGKIGAADPTQTDTSAAGSMAGVNAGEIQPGAVSLDKLSTDNCNDGQVLRYTIGHWVCADIRTSDNSIALSLPKASASSEGLLSASDYAAFSAKQSALTFGDGLNNSDGTITSTLATGLSGGQTVTGGVVAGDDLTLTSTASASKGKILFGTSAYDETNNRLGIGTASPSYALDIETTSANGLLFNVASTSSSLTGSGLASIDWSPASATTSSGDLVSINAGNNATIGSLLRVSSRGASVFTVGQNSVTFGKPVSFNASSSYPVNIVFDDYAVADTDDVILAEAIGKNIAITLPSPVGIAGREYTVKRLDAPTYTLSIVPGAGSLIDQQNSLLLSHQGDSVQLVSDGTNWQIIGQWASSYTYATPIPYVKPPSDTDSQGN